MRPLLARLSGALGLARDVKPGGFALLVLVLSACITAVEPSPSPSPTGTPDPFAPLPAAADMTETLQRTELPANDVFALTRRLRGRDGSPGPWQPVRATVPDRQVGARETFFYYNFKTKKNERVTAVIRQRTEHAYWYVQEDVPVDPARLAQTALDFEGRILPAVRRLYGEEWSPGIDNDPRSTVLFARIPDVAGYFSAADEYPKWVNEFSAEREMIYVNIDAAPPGSAYLLAVLAHEYAHMVQFNKRKRSVIWFNEGMAQIAEHATGFTPGFPTQFFRAPDTQLTDWVDEPTRAAAHYGHAFLFLQYLAERFGGTAMVRELMERGVDTPRDLDAVLQRHGTNVEEVYLDFVAANALAAQANPPAPYRYDQLRGAKPRLFDLSSARLAREGVLEIGEQRRSSVHQYAARYFELPVGTYALEFRGVAQVRLLPTEPRSGRACWWSNRGDAVNTSLQRKVDLRGARSATLTFWTWFDIEKDFDYAYVSVSVDGGATWKTLRGTLTTDDDPNGNNFGNGITGISGKVASPAWVQERMDLSPFAGKEIILRFDYVTDGALNKDGIAIDDLAIPEIGWKDDAESARDWAAAGFVRSSNVVRERFALQVLWLGDAPKAERTLVGPDGKARLELEVGAPGSALLAVTAFATHTVQPGTFEIRLEKRE